MFRKTYLKINLNNYFDNIDVFEKTTSKKLMAVVKANAYGTVDYYMTKKMEEKGVDFFAVSSLEEAIRLRNHDIKSNILIMGYIDDLSTVKKYDLSIIIPNIDFVTNNINELNNIKVHIKVNTGLNRLGVFPNETKDILNQLLKAGSRVEGIMTHFACANDEDYTYRQYYLFKEVLNSLDYKFKYIHTSATDAALYLNDDVSNYIRVGLGLLGYANIKHDKPLKNTLHLVSEVIYSKKVEQGDGVSYGHNYISDGEGYINTVAIGYADGLSRELSGKEVLVGDEVGIVVGTVCMDLIMVKTKNKHQIHELVEIIGDNFTVDRRKDELNTCCCKIICDIQDRVTRVYELDNKIIDEINLRN